MSKRKSPALYTKKYKKAKTAKSVVKSNLFTSKPNLFNWATVTYCDQPYTLNPGAGGAAAVQVISANGLYDVDFTGVGHQPTGFDQYMALYNEYCVTDAEIEVYFYNQDSTNPMQVGIAFLDFSTTTTDTRRYIENGNCVSKIIGNATGATPNISSLRMKAHIQNFTKSQNILTENGFSGSATANPVDTHYFHVWAAPVEGVDGGIVIARIVVTYKAIFRDPSFNTLS